MTAEEFVRGARLNEALEDLQGRIRKAPADPKLRVFLFQLLSVMGQWQRALTQLQVVGELDASTLPMVQTYREVIRCELLRTEIFAGRKTPVLIGKPDEWLALMIQALQAEGAGRVDEAKALRDRAFNDAPAVPGRIDDQPFQWLADADPRLGPVLEVMVNGRYSWVPLLRLREIRMEKPVDLRDMVWTAATLTWATGGESPALIPTRYPGSEKADDARVAMSRVTEWVERPGGAVHGMGQRLLTTDQGDHPFLDVRVITLDLPEALAEGAGTAERGGAIAADGPTTDG